MNFDHIYGQFANTYYASRLPWILPGRIVYSVLPTDAAYWVLHGLAFVGGVAALFVLARRYLGMLVAWREQRLWRSPHVLERAVLGLRRRRDADVPRRRPLLRPAADHRPSAGRFTRRCGSVLLRRRTNDESLRGLIALIYPTLYVFVQPSAPIGRRLWEAAKDVLPGARWGNARRRPGASTRTPYGGRFLFFDAADRPHPVRAVGASKLEDYEWVATSRGCSSPCSSFSWFTSPRASDGTFARFDSQPAQRRPRSANSRSSTPGSSWPAGNAGVFSTTSATSRSRSLSPLLPRCADNRL